MRKRYKNAEAGRRRSQPGNAGRAGTAVGVCALQAHSDFSRGRGGCLGARWSARGPLTPLSCLGSRQGSGSLTAPGNTPIRAPHHPALALCCRESLSAQHRRTHCPGHFFSCSKSPLRQVPTLQTGRMFGEDSPTCSQETPKRPSVPMKHPGSGEEVGSSLGSLLLLGICGQTSFGRPRGAAGQVATHISVQSTLPCVFRET